jgi:hypothetical protein
VPSEVLDLIWPQVKPALEKGARRIRDSHSMDHIHDWVLAGTQQLWVATENAQILAACISEVHRHPIGKKAFHLVLAGGRDTRRWFPLAFERWVEFAHLHGCLTIRVIGRKGWLHFFKPHGFNIEAYTLSREEV